MNATSRCLIVREWSKRIIRNEHNRCHHSYLTYYFRRHSSSSSTIQIDDIHENFPMNESHGLKVNGEIQDNKKDDSSNTIKWSFYKRVLPSNLIALNSNEGKERFREALGDGTLESYFPLSEQFLTQSDPAYCGVATLAMVLNSLSIDPNVRWKGGWRWVTEDVLLGPASQCCITAKHVQSFGITVDQFQRMGQCFGANIRLRRPLNNNDSLNESNSLCDFRADAIELSKKTDQVLVTSFGRADLQQTGEDGHFSPIAGYHCGTDSVLVMDVARFKYAPYWVSIESLYNAMKSLDSSTGLCRGWFIVRCHGSSDFDNEGKRPAALVSYHDANIDVCPIGRIKKNFCPVAPTVR